MGKNWHYKNQETKSPNTVSSLLATTQKTASHDDEETTSIDASSTVWTTANNPYNIAVASCSPNPCDPSASCTLSDEGRPFCKCLGQDKYFPAGEESCNNTSEIQKVENYDMKTDWNVCFPENICGDGIRCITSSEPNKDVVTYCECPNGKLVELGEKCVSVPHTLIGVKKPAGESETFTATTTTTTTATIENFSTRTSSDNKNIGVSTTLPSTSTALIGMQSSSTEQQQGDTMNLCSDMNPCGMNASCLVVNGEVQCSCDSLGSSSSTKDSIYIPPGQPCPSSSVTSNESNNIFIYVGAAAMIGFVILFCLWFRRWRQFRPKKSNPEKQSTKKNSRHYSEYGLKKEDDSKLADQELGLSKNVYRKEKKKASHSTTKISSKDRTQALLWRGRILMLSACALYGTHFAITKEVVSTIPITIVLCIRLGIPAFLTLPLLTCFRLGKGKEPPRNGWKGPFLRGFESGIYYGIAQLCQAYTLRKVSASLMAFLCGLTTVLIPFYNTLTGQPPNLAQVLISILALTGVAILSFADSIDSSSSVSEDDVMTEVTTTTTTMSAKDYFIAASMSIAFSSAYWRMGHAMDIYPEHPWYLTAAQALGNFLLNFFAFLVIEDLSELSTYPWSEWLADSQLMFYLIWTGVATTLLPNALIMMSLENLTSTEVALLFSSEQLFGAAFSVLFFGERLGWLAILGGSIIFLSCILSAYTNSEE